MTANPNTLPSRPLLLASSIRKSFAGVQALKDASFELLEGEVHALIGENGAGKSTLTKIITGTLVADSGSLEVYGLPVFGNSPGMARDLGIAAVYQQPSLFPHLTVAENIAFSLEGAGTSDGASVSWRVNWRNRADQARILIAAVGGVIDPGRLANTLSMAEQQIVEIAKALGTKARILLLDEPTALLTEREVENLFSLLRRLKKQGVGILYISHRLEEIASIADRITVMRDGETIACRRSEDVDRSELIRLMVGRSVAESFVKRPTLPDDAALVVDDLTNRSLGLHGISFFIRKGEIFGLAGLVGAGRTELARTLFGLSSSPASIELHGKRCTIRRPVDAIRLGIGYVPEDRRQHGVILEMSIASNISMACLQSISRWGLIDNDREDKLARGYVDRLGIKTASVSASAGTLSGGNQQKVALSRWLAIQPQLLIVDEPTQGVDVGAKTEIHEMILQLASRGVAILLISSELTELIRLSDRIGVLRAGTIAGTLDRQHVTQSKIMAMAFGHAIADPTAEPVPRSQPHA